MATHWVWTSHTEPEWKTLRVRGSDEPARPLDYLVDRPMPPLPPEVFVERSLSENRFWLRIMMEHSLFLKLGFRFDQTDLIRQAQAFQDRFAALLSRAEQMRDPTPEEVRAFNEEVLRQTRRLRDFKRALLLAISESRLLQANTPLLIDHIARESEYFMGKLNNLNLGILQPLKDSIVDENIFWLRIMADHAAFVSHLLDPSERRFIQQANGFDRDFRTLLAQARDLESILKTATTSPPVLRRFNRESLEEAERLREFKRAAAGLVRNGRILTVIDPLLADHVVREAERFLEILRELEAGKPQVPGNEESGATSQGPRSI